MITEEKYKEFLENNFSIVPLVRNISAENDTPLSLYLKISDQKNNFLLESVEGGEKWAQYSIIGFGCLDTIKVSGSKIETYQATCWGGLQRNLRIMGTLTNLYLRFDRSFRMQDLPQIVSNTITLSLELEQRHLSSFLKDVVLPKLKKKMSLL